MKRDSRPGSPRSRRLARRVLVRLAVYPAAVIAGLALVGTLMSLSPPRLVSDIDPGQLGLDFREVSFSAPGGPLLRGWFIEVENARGNIICLHGYPADKGDILASVAFLHPDFNLLLFDFRAMGESGGLLTTFGWREREDVAAALSFLRALPGPGDLPTGLWGYSMGGATAIMSASGSADYAALVTDSAFASLDDLMEIYYRPLGPLAGPVALLSRGIFPLLAGVPVGRVSPEIMARNLDTPLLLVHNAGDPVIPSEHALRLRAAAGPGTRLLVGNQGIHGAASDPGHREAVRDFFLEHLRPEPAGPGS